jgi:hypothetical protein
MKGKRKARKGEKVSWKDEFGNTHDLDFVLERTEGDEQIGTPVALSRQHGDATPNIPEIKRKRFKARYFP